jgi:rhodanese-related sulfurtransferase
MKNISLKYLGFGVLLLLGLVLAFSPVDQAVHKMESTEKLLQEFQKSSVYIPADELGHWIIDKQPGFLVVDIRSADDYAQYKIPGSVNISLTELAAKDNLDLFKTYETLILASNGNTFSGQAWLLLRQKGFKSLYVLQGGLNNWVNTFSNPKAPEIVYADDEVFTYQFRKAAGPALMGTSAAIENESPIEQNKTVPVKRISKKKGKKIDEGC